MGLALSLDGEPEVAGMTPERILDFHKRRIGFRVQGGTGAGFTAINAAPLHLLLTPEAAMARPVPAELVGRGMHFRGGGFRGD